MGASEHSEEPKVRSSRWSLVSWSSLVESLSSDSSASAKKESNRRPTSIWTVAGMAAISALFIYMIQTAFVVPGSSGNAETPRVRCQPEGVSKSDPSTAGASFGSVAEQAAAGNRKVAGGRANPDSASMKSQDSGDTQERAPAEERTEEGAIKPRRSQGQGQKAEEKPKMAHVFISTDETDLRPIFVVINSTLANARHPENVDFNLIMPETNEAAARAKLLPLFPGVKIEINRGKIDVERINQLITYKEGTGARRELVSVFNFIPFYLPFISRDLDRIVYLDADVVVVGDIAELATVDMEGRAAAAVEDCMQMFKTYFDFKQLAQIQAHKDPTKPWMPHFQYDKKTCVFNRGVLLIDVQQWIKENMTESIEWWMKKFRDSKEPLYKFGLSQPPFLLALYQRYKKLDRCWNTRGLGRDSFGEKERDFLARIGFGRPPKSPFLSPWADSAKIMHFNGKYKPWRLPRVRPEGEKPKALCGEAMSDCAEHWWKYMDMSTLKLLDPSSQEDTAEKTKGDS